jgi:phosphate transport system protein
MFRELLEALRQRPLLKQMVSEMEQMLGDAVEMYRPIAQVLTGRRELSEETHEAIYETDIRINRLQRNIRKQLVEHLLVSPGTDVPICLVLMSIIKDAERVGDICKNMLEVAEAIPGTLPGGRYEDRFADLLARTEELFEPTANAFRSSDKDLGHTTVERARALAKECDGVIDELLADDLPCRDAVVFTLMARYLKRICSHLSNIATSVVMPLDMLDYFDEPTKPER